MLLQIGWAKSMRTLLFKRQEGNHQLCQVGYGHGLQIDPAGTGDDGVNEALAAQQHVLHAFDHLHVHGAGLIHNSQYAGIAYELLAGGKVIILTEAVHLQEYQAGAGDLLHYKALAANKTGPQLLLEVHGELYAVGSAKEGVLLADNALAGAKLPGYYPSGEGR